MFAIIQHTHWVVFSLIALIITSLIILKNPRPLLIVILVSLLPLYAVFRPGTYESGDLSVHASKLIPFYESLKEGHLLPRWAGHLNAGYGYPLFLNTYLTPYYFGSLFVFLGAGYLTAMKLVIASSFILSGLFMYLWIKNWLSSSQAGVVAAIFYLFTPYHLVTMHFRVAIGEVVSFVFIPLVFLGLHKHSWLLTALSFWFLILSHQVTALSILPVFIIYALITSPKQIFSLLLGILLAAHYWVPMLWESKFIYQSLDTSRIFFPKFSEFIYTPWRYGLLFQGHYGELGFLVGYTQIFVLILGFIKKDKSLLLFSGLYLAYFLFMQSFAKTLWNILPLVHNFQFSYRLLLILCVLISIIAALVTNYLQPKFVYFLCAVTIGYTILNWAPRQNLSTIGDRQLIDNLPYITHDAEGWVAAPIWLKLQGNNPWVYKIPSPIAATVLDRKSDLHLYKISASEPVTISENTTYYPGWEVQVDGQLTPIDYSDGTIRFQLPPGDHFVRVQFKNTPIRQFSTTLTVLGLLICLLAILRKSITSHQKDSKGHVFQI